MWLYSVPVAFLGSVVWKLPVYVAVLLVQLETLIKIVFLIKRYLSGKWLKNMIHGMD